MNPLDVENPNYYVQKVLNVSGNEELHCRLHCDPTKAALLYLAKRWQHAPGKRRENPVAVSPEYLEPLKNCWTVGHRVNKNLAILLVPTKLNVQSSRRHWMVSTILQLDPVSPLLLIITCLLIHNRCNTTQTSKVPAKPEKREVKEQGELGNKRNWRMLWVVWNTSHMHIWWPFSLINMINMWYTFTVYTNPLYITVLLT